MTYLCRLPQGKCPYNLLRSNDEFMKRCRRCTIEGAEEFRSRHQHLEWTPDDAHGMTKKLFISGMATGQLRHKGRIK